MSAAFRARVTNEVYLSLISAAFGILAVIVGLPTLVIRSSKFVICITLCKIRCIFSSSNVIKGGLAEKIPVLLLLFSVVTILHVTIFYPRYLFVLVAGCFQVDKHQQIVLNTGYLFWLQLQYSVMRIVRTIFPVLTICIMTPGPQLDPRLVGLQASRNKDMNSYT